MDFALALVVTSSVRWIFPWESFSKVRSKVITLVTLAGGLHTSASCSLMTFPVLASMSKMEVEGTTPSTASMSPPAVSSPSACTTPVHAVTLHRKRNSAVSIQAKPDRLQSVPFFFDCPSAFCTFFMGIPLKCSLFIFMWELGEYAGKLRYTQCFINCFFRRRIEYQTERSN